jgi:hypothetical protein
MEGNVRSDGRRVPFGSPLISPAAFASAVANLMASSACQMYRIIQKPVLAKSKERRAGEGSVLTGGGYPHHRPTSKVPARRLLASRFRHVWRTGMVQSESRVDGDRQCESSDLALAAAVWSANGKKAWERLERLYC